MTQSRVLFTKKITNNQKNSINIALDCYDFISIEMLDFHFPTTTPASHFVFTSKNAVDAVLSQYEINTTQSIYAVGKSTKAKLLEYAAFKNIQVPYNQYNAEGLIELFEQNNSNNFRYFCGKKRLPKLEDYFKTNQKKHQVIEVYDTILSPPSNLDTKNYQWLCFCSPSSIESFLTKYELLPHQDILCIGNTTAKVLNSHKNRIHVAKKATIDSMLNYLEEHYKN
ncbi:uroporphyrinogen-III synthase [Balneicella halophila]|uniref:Uroporphyrinogen-III synthase n=1 Tax=Balneicella halophila TaxID=1537566 RepID=A0A7L4UMT2_BALHA|nr:uroporphyrinogen-III synthase [Balneicella halophila]PVX49934.1 uroporphyrinogen-III synthase [Balneicella halophila]